MTNWPSLSYPVRVFFAIKKSSTEPLGSLCWSINSTNQDSLLQSFDFPLQLKHCPLLCSLGVRTCLVFVNTVKRKKLFRMSFTDEKKTRAESTVKQPANADIFPAIAICF